MRGYIMEHTLQKTSACGLGEETEVFFEDVFELNICVWFVIGFEIWAAFPFVLEIKNNN